MHAIPHECGASEEKKEKGVSMRKQIFNGRDGGD